MTFTCCACYSQEGGLTNLLHQSLHTVAEAEVWCGALLPPLTAEVPPGCRLGTSDQELLLEA